MKIFKWMIVLTLIYPLFINVGDVNAQEPLLAYDVRTRISVRAAQLAVESMPGIYSWEEGRTCSSFVGNYLRELSFPVNGLSGQYEEYEDPFPWSGVVAQVSWLRRNVPQDYIHDAPLLNFLEGELWGEIEPGDIIYLQNPVGHNGYDTYYHVVILIGYLEDGSPQFAEIASGVEASYERSFGEVTSFYPRDANGNWLINPYSEGDELIVTWFDPLAYLNGGLWQREGRVVPNSEYLQRFSTVLTVNLYDGTTSIYTNSQNRWRLVYLGGRNEFYAVVGRLLPANRVIGEVFFQRHENEIYDSDFGIYISNGVYQHSWTPQLISRLETFDYVSGFGGLNGGTDTAIMIPLVLGQDGQVREALDYSPFTIHRIPDVVNQDMLLRMDLLEVANDPRNDEYGHISVPQVNLSSGCVNFDPSTWALIKGYLIQRINEGVGIVFSYPDFDQNLILGNELFRSAFTGSVFYRWCPESGDVYCDMLDRRAYRDTYLDSQ